MQQIAENSKTYLFLAAMIAVGLFFETLKFWPTNHPLSNTEEMLMLSKPYAVSENTMRLTTKTLPIGTHLEVVQPIALPEINLKGDIEKWQKEQDKLKAEENKKKAAAKNWHWAWNKKQQRWEWKKKTKKKPAAAKAADVQTADTQPDIHPPAAPQNQTPSVTGIPGTQQSAVASTTGLGAAGATGTPHKFLSAQEWIDFLDSSPSQSKTDTFVQQYNQHLVTSQVFYQVVNSMLKNSNINVQTQGIYALGKTPSVESFEILATESTTLQTASPLAQAATQDLAKYAQIANIGLLQQVLGQTTQNSGVLTVALNELQTSIQSNLTSGTTGNPTAQGGNASHYQAFVPILKQLSAQNSTIAAEAGQILSLLAQNGIH